MKKTQMSYWTQYSIRDLEINDKILANYSILPVKENPLAGHTDVYSQQMYTDMLSFWNNKTASLDPNILTVYKYDDYYDQMVGALGTQGSVWYSILEDQIVETEGFEDKRQQIAGVSTDEELGSPVSSRAIKQYAAGARAAINAEPGGIGGLYLTRPKGPGISH